MEQISDQINRKQTPEFREFEQINLIEPELKQLENGISFYTLNAGEQELVRIEFILPHVNWNTQKPLQATATLSLFNEGTRKFTAAELAENLDYYGAFLQTDFSFDDVTVALYTLNKHAAQVLPLLKNMLTEAVFPQNELTTYIRNQKQKLLVSMEKNEFLVRKRFNKLLFGDNLYGHETSIEDFDTLNQQQLLEYYSAAYQPKLATIIASGKITPEIKQLIDLHFSSWENTGDIGHKNHFHFDEHPAHFEKIEKADALQSAIRLGKRMVNRVHADFPGLQVLNTVLGGYFGSRLMANIREDKGYTYGIGSAIVSLQQSGYFFVASEVGADVCADAIKEIKHEISTLREHLIPQEELVRVRNYMLGSFLGSLENAFSHADKFKNIHFAGLDYSYYTRYIETVKHISAKELLHLAQRYFHPENLVTVVAGKYEDKSGS